MIDKSRGTVLLHPFTTTLLVLNFCAPVWGQFDIPDQKFTEEITVRREEAEKNLVKRVRPVYPGLAEAAHITGVVRLHALISITGAVDTVKYVSGHPLLAQAAVDAVKQWQYKPFVVGDQAVATIAEVEVLFALGVSIAKYQTQQASIDAYFNLEDKCRTLLKLGKYEEAEGVCGSSVNSAERLPKGQVKEQMTANSLTGEALFFQKKYPEALSFFQRELAIGEKDMRYDDVDLGYAHYHLALSYEATGELKNAQSHFEQAEGKLRAARKRVPLESSKAEFGKAIQSLLKDFIALLKQTGQEAAAAKAQQRADAIAAELRH